MHGLLLIDKPAGVTSHDVVRQVRRICKTRKVGHAGTLDPLATGVLPVAVGDGTKILQFLFADSKSYRASFRLGISTDTLDAEGQVLQETELPADCEQLLEPVLSRFRGRIEQVPPMYSALKKDGVPLYKLARQGTTVDRAPRPVCIDRLELLQVSLPDVTIEVDCSKGTYIRSLVNDIGDALGCGAHLTELRRLRSGNFCLDSCLSLGRLQQAVAEQGASALLGLDAALEHYPAVQVTGNAIRALKNGVPPELENTISSVALVAGELVRLQVEGALAAIARYAPKRLQEKRGDFELVRVFIADSCA